MRRILLLMACVCLNTPWLLAQNQYLGEVHSNFGGTHSVLYNPAQVADSRFKVYINLAHIGATAGNNYVFWNAPYTPFQYFTGRVPDQYKDANGNPKFLMNQALVNGQLRAPDSNYVMENLNGKDKWAGIAVDVQGPAFMFNVNKWGFGFHTRARMFFQAQRVGEQTARVLYYGIDRAAQLNSTRNLIEQARFQVTAAAFTDVGISVGRVIWDGHHHFVKAGATVKRISGLYAAYFQIDGLNYRIDTADNGTLITDNVNMSYGYVNPDVYSNFQTSDILKYITGQRSPGSGWGVDIGATYEWRPNIGNYAYQMDGKTRYHEGRNKYFIRVDASINDIGYVKYKGNDIRNRTVSSNSQVKITQVNNLNLSGVDSVDAFIGRHFGFDSQSDQFRTSMPSALNLAADVRIVRWVYANLAWTQSLRSKGDFGARMPSSLALTPRFETRWFELSLPISLQNDYRDVAMGAMLRAGVLTIGSDRLGSLFGLGSKLSSFDVYFGLQIPIHRNKVKDKDKDGISNRKDLCRKVPGVLAFQGCPDSDNDSIPDSEDHCPYTAGIAQFQGCPDTDADGIQDTLDACPLQAGPVALQGCPDRDEDGIADKNDSCPDAKGLLEFAGCPDTDGDKIIDVKDQCPDVPGKPEFAGCPDTDNDSIPDAQDRCPYAAGKLEFGGCPDTDGDGLTDADDRCPEVPGPVALQGCPDRDGDGIIDKDDKCPDEKGVVEMSGCPKLVETKIEEVVITEEEKKILKDVFSNLEFETGKSAIKASSFDELDQLVELLNTKPEYRIYIAGHTDNVGKPASNLKLSFERANAVKAYLKAKGIHEDRIIAEGFGQTKPIASNKTAAGKQKNRRVEFKVIK